MEEDRNALGEDGLFKLLTWNSLAITPLFGLPEIVGEPIKQELHHSLERRVDRLLFPPGCRTSAAPPLTFFARASTI
jgi:hypothetical protein